MDNITKDKGTLLVKERYFYLVQKCSNLDKYIRSMLYAAFKLERTSAKALTKKRLLIVDDVICVVGKELQELLSTINELDSFVWRYYPYKRNLSKLKELKILFLQLRRERDRLRRLWYGADYDK